MYAHSWVEILLYVVPFITIFLTQKYFKSSLKYFVQWPLTVAIVLIPLWLTTIYLFGWLLYDLNVLPFILLICCFSLLLQLYDYIRTINHFTFNRYYLLASKLFFTQLTMFLIGLMILRILTLFIQ